jgi:predicted cupin superfamily sugar epimerase
MLEEEAMRLVELLGLRPHPEGGYFGEAFRSCIEIEAPWAARAALTSIHYLLSRADFSSFHRLRSDEILHNYRGAPVTIEVITPEGNNRQVVIGDGKRWQAAIGAGAWFAAHVQRPDTYALVGCDVAPGFTYEDFEIGKRAALIRSFPHHRALIERWTRE